MFVSMDILGHSVMVCGRGGEGRGGEGREGRGGEGGGEAGEQNKDERVGSMLLTGVNSEGWSCHGRFI